MIKDIWTIGHSNNSINDFIEMLQLFQIKILADVRSFPGSGKFPHFNIENLSLSLNNEGIEYHHLKELGGRRKANPDSKNIVWKNEAFRGYADYMETEDFHLGIKNLISLAEFKQTAFMCSEALWWRCHRSLISDYLKSKEWSIHHIMNKNKSEEHHYTKPAKIIGGNLFYNQD
jgi:uncharacterized protein (DUF488 family)